MIKMTIVSLSMLMSTLPFGVDFDALTGTQTITGTLSSNLAITVSSTGKSNVGEDGSYDCTSNFFPSTGTGSFARGQVADSQCTYITMTASSTAWEVEVEVTDDVECGFMYDDDASDDWGNDGGDTLLTHTGHNTSTNCDAEADQANINSSGNGSSVFLFAEGIDIDATDQPAAATGTPTDLIKCTAPVSSVGMFVDIRVVVPDLALDGTYEMNLTYTIKNT
jgi:hypothetical protein